MNVLFIIVIMAHLLMSSLIAQEVTDTNVQMSNAERVSVAYESSDIDSIRRMILNWNDSGILVFLLLDKPMSQRKEEVALAILESPWPGDRQSYKLPPIGSSAPLAYYQLAIELLAPLMSEEKLIFNDEKTYQRLSNFEERKKLVSKYKEARKKVNAVESSTKKSRINQLHKERKSASLETEFSSTSEHTQHSNMASSKDEQIENKRYTFLIVLLISLIAIKASVFAEEKQNRSLKSWNF